MIMHLEDCLVSCDLDLELLDVSLRVCVSVQMEYFPTSSMEKARKLMAEMSKRSYVIRL